MLGGRLELRSSNESEAENDGDGHEPVGAIRGRARIVAREAGENKRKRVRSSDGTKNKRLQSMSTKFWNKGLCCKASMALKGTCCAEDYDNLLVFQIRRLRKCPERQAPDHRNDPGDSGKNQRGR
jgi:hypothetical protein